MEAQPSRRLSCGVVILTAQRELLLCHVTGQDHWDLPKGGAHVGESPLQAALRETREETGLHLDAHALLDLGRLEYRPKTDLHLFATLMPRCDVGRLHCESHFAEAATGARLPEMDGYDWFAFEHVAAACTPKMAAVLCARIDLRALPDMCFDTDPLVRREVAERLPLDQLRLLVADSDLRVRYRVAERIAEEELVALLDDPEPAIRELAAERIGKVAHLAHRLVPRARVLRLASETPTTPSETGAKERKP